MSINITDDLINNVLYSGIRNDHHLKIRRIGFFKHILKSIYTLITKRSKINNSVHGNSLLNYFPENSLDLGVFETRKFNFLSKKSKSLVSIEILLLIGFLINVKFLQRFFFRVCFHISNFYIKKNNVKALVCGHPTILVCFLGVCMKEQKKEVITVQHGIYNLNFYKVLWFEKNIATKVIVFGNSFKGLYEEQGVNPRNLIIGNPYFGSKIAIDENSSMPIKFIEEKVIFIGQQLYKISPTIGKGYNEFLSDLLNYFEDRNIDFYYKPHPREVLIESLTTENIERIKLLNSNVSYNFLSDFDVYFSPNSSLLIETYLQKKVCFQINLSNSELNFDKFQDYMGIPHLNHAADLNEYLKRDYNYCYNKNYLNIKDNPKISLSNIIIDILN